MARKHRQKHAAPLGKPQGLLAGAREIVATLLPPLLLFIAIEWVVYQLLFFIPAEWRWEVESERRRGRVPVIMTARVLATLLISIPIFFYLYIQAKKLIRRRQR